VLTSIREVVGYGERLDRMGSEKVDDLRQSGQARPLEGRHLRQILRMEPELGVVIRWR
jgi:hypothetical protein